MSFWRMRIRPLAWLRSLHAKLFVLLGLVTSVLTVAVAYNITRNSRRELESYSRKLTIEAAGTVETDIVERDPTFKDPDKLDQLLESIAGPDRSIFQIDVFKRLGKGSEVELVRSSGEEKTVEWGPEIGSYLSLPGPQAELVDLNTGTKAWKVYLPIHTHRPGQPPIGLIRAYCDLERWEVVWNNNFNKTVRTLPGVLLGEFILLWLILRVLISDPIEGLVLTMQRLEQGEVGARAPVRRSDELGLIAARFNDMAAQLEQAAKERESLLHEVRGLNTNLQGRIDAALSELQAKNDELAALVERNALLREELSAQERLAVAGQLTATFAHEVGTPLNLVTGHLQLLDAQKDLPDKTRERLAVITGQIKRVGDIVRRLLDLTRRPQLHREVQSLGELLHDLQQLWTPTLAAHGIHVVADAPSSCSLDVDRKQMEQLFLNLMNNAVDAMPEGGTVRLSARPSEDSTPGGLWWEFRFQDSGQGIPADLLSKVFRPMFTTKPEGKGTGLGLSICREIVRGHGGDIRIESTMGQGTCVVFTLPGASAA
ncbi:sensor histidine kinase [Geothrix sp. PMB-07]|uniref:sensor histidine kinase n=1 Tax=Geothrix sp. PMB-07 TaxID=3068640 RepID=UPI0027415025|nr:HAMP domain-containing sensor histidine kinase [Geothrix sp. PMB-07]WLT31578.1 HAMP domain-containing sensor histidine kinase [Geothrix sp. PMB-07]